MPLPAVLQHLPSALISARTSRGVTRLDLAREVSRITQGLCTPDQIEMYERGHLIPSVVGLCAIAEALGQSLDDLCGRAGGGAPVAPVVDADTAPVDATA